MTNTENKNSKTRGALQESIMWVAVLIGLGAGTAKGIILCTLTGYAIALAVAD